MRVNLDSMPASPGDAGRNHKTKLEVPMFDFIPAIAELRRRLDSLEAVLRDLVQIKKEELDLQKKAFQERNK